MTQITSRTRVAGLAVFAALLLSGAAARANDPSQPNGSPMVDYGNGRTVTYQHGTRVTTTLRQPNVRVIGRPVNTPHQSTAVRPGAAWPYYTGPAVDQHSAEVGFQGWTYYVTPGPVYELWHGR